MFLGRAQTGTTNASLRGLSALMTLVYVVASMFVVGNFILCYHEDGAVYLELSKIKQNVSTAEADTADNVLDCDDTDCNDSSISSFTLASAGLKSFDADTAKVHVTSAQIVNDLTPEAQTHNGWRSDPPSLVNNHYTSILKPTLVLLV